MRQLLAAILLAGCTQLPEVPLGLSSTPVSTVESVQVTPESWLPGTQVRENSCPFRVERHTRSGDGGSSSFWYTQQVLPNEVVSLSDRQLRCVNGKPVIE